MRSAVHRLSDPLRELNRFLHIGPGPNSFDSRLKARREDIIAPINDGVSHTVSLPFKKPLFTLLSPTSETLSKPILAGEGKAITELRELLKKVAKSKVNVLITGETGTGKELAAKMLYENSFRNLGPFIPVNCSAIPKQLIESTLFGHVKGSFTGASTTNKGLFLAANNGTIFLDEIGELDESSLLKLIRVIQTGKLRQVGGDSTNETEVNVRVIAATNKDLSKVVRDQILLQSLYNAVKGFPISMPPLRTHKEDIPDIASNLLYRNLKIVPEKIITSFSPEALEILNKHDWPGNVRELENVIKRAMVLSPDETIQEADIVISKFIPSEKQAECIADIAASEANVFIYGEPGTEIELIAEDIHSLSKRKNSSLVTVDCASIPTTLAESDFFGHVKGAFTDAKTERIGHFESANDGTLVLLGVDKLPLELQSMLLRVLQEGKIMKVGGTSEIPVNPRIITTATSDLEKLVKEGRFREDLYNRLIVIPLKVPSLRERSGDIEASAEELLQELNEQGNKKVLGFSPQAISKLKRYRWPGNLDELKNVVSRAFILADGDTEITPEHILLDNADNVLPSKNELPAYYKNKFIELFKKGALTLFEVEQLAVTFHMTNKFLDDAPSITTTALAQKFKVDPSTVNRKIIHGLGCESFQDFKVKMACEANLITQAELQTNNNHPVLDNYINRFLELATSNEPVDFEAFHIIALKYIILKKLIAKDYCAQSANFISQQMGISRQTLSKLLMVNGYESLAKFIAELKDELKK